LLILVPFLWFSLTVEVVQIAAAKLGFAPGIAILLLTAIVLGSTINIPLYRIESRVEIIDICHP
jgi:uncharacterized membrane protein